jgi:DNA/RNA endonuclease YhcR with UshA esterase domain
MKTKTLLVSFALIALAIAQASPTYTAAEAAKHVGETATVKDTVDGFHQSGKGNIFLNMGGKYPNQAFTAFIQAASAAQFSQAQQYEGQIIAVSGKITLYKGKPEIVVTSSAD